MEFRPFKIGKYLLLEKLATGGMAEVYRARASGAGGFEKQLAIKRILPNYSSNEEFRRMFEYEARLSSMLTHANIVQIYDFVKLGDTYLLAMEYVNGKNLRQFINKVKKMGYAIPIELSVYIMNEVCKGLEYAHNKKDELTGKVLNIIHRDMSPQNIMISYEGAVKIVDFGIAKAKDRVDETRSGVIKGKFGYMSPEQANGLPVDHRTDIFSTGIILYELLSNRRLFAAENDLATLKLIQECVIPKPSVANPKISYELEKILSKGLTRDPKDRFQNAGNFHRQLQEYLNKEFPTFTAREAADILHRVFESEIENEKKRYEQIHRQSIPFSQGIRAGEPSSELDSVEEALEGTITRSEHADSTGVTFAGEDEFSEKSQPPSISTEQGEEPVRLENTQIESVDSREKTLQDAPEIMEVSHTEITKIEEGMASIREISKQTGSGLPLLSAVKGGESDSKTEGAISNTESGVVKLQVPQVGSRIDQRSYSLIQETLKKEPAAPPTPAIGKQESVKIGIEIPKSVYVYRSPEIEREYQPAPLVRSRSILSLLFVFALVGGVFYLYSILFSGEMGRYIGVLKGNSTSTLPAPRVVAENPPENPAPIPSQTVQQLGNTCMLTIESDPPAANIFIDKESLGVSPQSLSTKCRASVNVTLKKSGYEPTSTNVFVEKKDTSITKSLRRIPMGELQFTLDVNSRVFVDGDEVGQALAGKPFIVAVRANLKHKIRFLNDIMGVDSTQEYTAQDGLRFPYQLKLTEPTKRNPALKR